MRKRERLLALLLSTALCMGMAGCAQEEKRTENSGSGQAAGEESSGSGAQAWSENAGHQDTKIVLDGAEYDIRETKITLDGIEYDLAEREGSVNAISGIRDVDGYWIVQGHISPQAAWYGFYNRENGVWEKEILCGSIAWEEPFSLDSVVYNVANELYDWEGTFIGKVDLDPEEYECIWSLRRTASQVEVEIQNGAAEYRTVTIDLL